MRFFLLIILFLSQIAGATVLLPFDADLEAIRYGVIDVSAKGTLSLQQQSNEHWRYRLASEGRTIQIEEQVQLRIQNDLIQPVSYRFNSKIFWSKKTNALSFDLTNGQVTGEMNEKPVQLENPIGLFDPLGFQLELQRLLIKGEREISIDVIRKGKVIQRVFEVIGEEQLSLPQGEAYTWIIEQTQPRKNNERHLIWVAPKWNFVPLRFARFEDQKLKEEIRTLRLRLDGEAMVFGAL